jgi:uridylate kinase
MDKKEYIIISLGGSIVVPDQIDTELLRNFTEAIKEYVEKGFRFVIITGGGKTCRNYNNSLKQIVSPSMEDLDWMGIASTRLNAELVRICFGNLAYEKIILNPDSIPETDKPIMVGGGWQPGNSSDLAAVHMAKSIGAKKIINLSNIDYVYNKDPREYKDAVPITQSSWADFRKLLPVDWDPGLNLPFDPIAAREAEALSFEVVVMNGKKVENLKKYLNGESFIGTIIK